MQELLVVAKGESELGIWPQMANRHGLIAGATGTGKTVTLRVLAEHFSRIGVPVFMADVKGDLASMALPGGENPKIEERVKQLGLDGFEYAASPVTFWDIDGAQGHPVRVTVSDMGPMLFSRLLNLNETQSGVMTIVFKVADDNGWLLLDLKDLRAILQYAAEHAGEIKGRYGNVSPASVGAIQRGLLGLEQQGADKLFGEPALDLSDFVQTDPQGRGVINVLAADKLVSEPLVYSTLLLWMMSELFESLPEVGDPEKPKLVFFFDEAHLLFDGAPKALLDKIEQVVRLIRSKGVGIYFVTQNPMDVPDTVLGQMGNRVQHALRAFTPKDQKAVRAAAQTFRANPKLDVEETINQLGVGEALVSFLDEKGIPCIVERAWIYPPHSKLGTLDPAQRQQMIRSSVVFGAYEKAIDRESAYELLKSRAEQAAEAAQSKPVEPKQPAPPPVIRGRTTREAPSAFESIATSAARAMASQAGRSLVRGMLGSLLGGGRKRSSSIW
jgi:DNA helicase HerA-like ATPase